MDLLLWDLSDDQGYFTSFEGNYCACDIWQCGHYFGYGRDLSVADKSGYYTEDHLLCDYSFGYSHDMIEEEALNEKSCLEVLKILMDKADEEIIKLEEDTVMLQCQLAWDDEDWSKTCSAALRENIDHLDILKQNLKMEITEDEHCSGLQLEQPEKLPQRLHDLLKPLLEDYFTVKNKQMPVLPAVGVSKKKSEASTSKENEIIEEKECTIMLKTNERKSQSMDLVERKINPEPRKDAVISKFNASAHKCAAGKLYGKHINKPNKLERRRMPNSAPVKSGRGSSAKSQPSNPVVKVSSVSMPTEKANSREREDKRNNDRDVISKARVTQHRLEHESKVTNSNLKLRETETQISEIVKLSDEKLDSQVACMKQRTEASSKVQKARVYRHTINKNVLSTKPLVKLKRKRTTFREITEASDAQETEMKYSPWSFNDRTKHAGEPKVKLEPKIQVLKLETKIQVQQRHEIETPVTKQAKSISLLKPEGQGPQKKCKAAPEMVQNSFPAENIDMGSSSTETLKEQQKCGHLEKTSKNGKKETQQQSNGKDTDSASEVTVTSISSPQKIRKLSSSSQTTREKKGLRNFLMKLATEEARDDVEHMQQNSSPCIKDVERLTLKDLKVIAKNQKLQGYYRLRKAELQKCLGLEPLYLRQRAYEKRGILQANTI